MKIINGGDLLEKLLKIQKNNPELLNEPIVVTVLDDDGDVINRYLNDVEDDNYVDIGFSGDIETYSEKEEGAKINIVLNAQNG